MNKVYEIITEKVVDALKAGVVPWRKPWNVTGHRNMISKKEYRGINPFLLDFKGHKSPFWMTYNQAKACGGNVKKGEKGTMVVFWKMLKKDNGNGVEKNIPLLRYYTVFNLDQCENIDPKHIPVDAKREHAPIADAEKVVAEFGDKPPVKHGGDRACYAPFADEVSMPHPENFKTGEGYYRTLFHEFGHSTGHAKRLARKDHTAFFGGKEDYAKEELVAEMTSAFLAGECSFTETVDNKDTVAYIGNWLKALNNDPTMVVSAAGQAQKAADYIRGRMEKKAEPVAVVATVEAETDDEDEGAE
jgi:antirestriction protein ArdC